VKKGKVAVDFFRYVWPFVLFKIFVQICNIINCIWTLCSNKTNHNKICNIISCYISFSIIVFESTCLKVAAMSYSKWSRIDMMYKNTSWTYLNKFSFAKEPSYLKQYFAYILNRKKIIHGSECVLSFLIHVRSLL
jgi:hypothetical protein